MGKRLKDNLSSAYFDAANYLNGRNARKRIVAYVESYDDIFFWRTASTQAIILSPPFSEIKFISTERFPFVSVWREGSITSK